MHPLSRIRMGALVLFAIAGLAASAGAAPKSTQIETEGEFVSFDAAAKTVTVKVLKPGKQVRGLPKLARGKEAEFNVEPEGSVLTRTTVKMRDGTAGQFTDLQAGRKVKVFWIPDPDQEGKRKARSIAVFVPAEEQGEDAE